MNEPAEDNKLIHVAGPLEVVDPAKQLSFARSVAEQCQEVAMRCSIKIGNKRHVEVEAWQAIAIAHGCVASSMEVERTETGYRARGIVKRMSDGAIIAEAEGFVGDDEPVWHKRSEHANRAFAQTRAISRACRSAFAHIVVMMKGGFSATPAEEMPRDNGEREERPAQPAEVGNWREVAIHFGKYTGRKLGEMDQGLLEKWLTWEPKPWKGKVNAADARLRAALDAAKADLAKANRSQDPAEMSQAEKDTVTEQDIRERQEADYDPLDEFRKD